MKKIFFILGIALCSCTSYEGVVNQYPEFVEVPDQYDGWVITSIRDIDLNGDSIYDVTMARISNGREPEKEIYMIIDIGQFYNKGDTLGKIHENL